MSRSTELLEKMDINEAVVTFKDITNLKALESFLSTSGFAKGREIVEIFIEKVTVVTEDSEGNSKEMTVKLEKNDAQKFRKG